MAVDIIVHPDPKRDRKAADIADQVGSWPRMILKQDFGSIPAGTVVRRAPSSLDERVRYQVCAISCTCPDYQERGAVCYHVRAYRLWEARQAQPAPARRPSYADLFPACPCGDVADTKDGYCDRCASNREHEQRMAGRREAFAAIPPFTLNPLAE